MVKIHGLKNIPKSKTHRKKISLAHKGKKHSEETKKKIGLSCSGINNGMYNKKHSLITKKRISYKLKKRFKNPENHPMFGKHFAQSEKTKEKISLALKSRKFTQAHKNKIGNALKYRIGINNPNYIDGRSFLPYTVEFNNTLKEKIRQRDDYTCQCCGMTEEEHLILYGYNLTIHHIDYNKFNNTNNNLISTCIQCNSRANSNREYWKEFYTKKLNIPT